MTTSTRIHSQHVVSLGGYDAADLLDLIPDGRSYCCLAGSPGSCDVAVRGWDVQCCRFEADQVQVTSRTSGPLAIRQRSVAH